MRGVGRLVLRAAAGVVVVLLVVAGMPWLLLSLTRLLLSDPPDVAQLVAEPLSAATVVLLVVACAWAFWGWLVVGAVLEAVDRLRRPGRVRSRAPAPLYTSVSAVVGTVALLLEGAAVQPANDDTLVATSTHDGGIARQHAEAPARQRGIEVAGAGWLPAPAAAAGAVAALIWVQRRRQYQPQTPGGAHRDDPELTPLPVPSDMEGRVVVGVAAGGWLDLADLPGEGVHLSGAGAVSALRGMVVSVLAAAATASARGPAVVISSGDLRMLIGGAVAAVPGLNVVDDQGTAATVGAVLAAAGQPVLLVRGGSQRHDGPTPAGMTVVSLDAALSLPSWEVRADGTVAAADVRLAVLNAAAAAVVLTGLRQATPNSAPVPVQDPVAPPAEPRRLSVGVLGPVRVECADGDAVSPVSVRRSAGMHLLVLLAVHRDGATGDDLAAALWPDLPTRPARRFATTLSELRQQLQQATGADVVERSNVLTGGSRYRLDPAAVDVDLWRFHDLLDTAASVATPAERRALLRQAADLDRGELAEGLTAAWLQPVREATARHRIDILTYLAGAEPDHGTALALLHRALRVAPGNEAIVRAVLRRHAAAGDLEGVHRAYTTLLDQRPADDDAPEPATAQLYEELTTTDPGVPATSGAPERTPR
ncbi:hypothetical protein [Dactylosporangium sp. NPDC000521]|uniref:AfsR/SARP family transcriptional regulator n=1 Tax=Dactylosporangium sp. NPDC000521 TaxID=3363975 RepID=UPI0036993F32